MNIRRLLTALALAVGLYVSTIQAAPPARPLLRPANPVTSPAGNTHTVPPTTTVSIIYDEPINPATVSPQTFAVHARQTGLLMQTYGVYSGTISLTPTHPLKSGELVQGSATAGTLSLLDGTGPASPTVWEFRVAVKGGDGFFADSGQRLGGSYGVEVALGDLDGDGDLDAFVVNGGGQANRVWLNDGTGSLIDSGQRLGGPWNHGLALGDLDGDGDLDAFVVNTRNNPNRVWLNDGTGTFHDSGQRLGNSRSNGVALGDLDGDGDLDAFVANYNFYDGQPNRVWLNDGTGVFYSGQRVGNSSSYAVALGDVDGDGDLDAFVANSHYYANRVWLNDGTGTFTGSGQGLGSSISWSVALGDLDDDGDLDAFVANSFGQANRMWRNNGRGTFYNSQRLGNSYSNGVDLGDLDGDGDLDVFVANWNGQANRVWLNDGTGTFTDSGQRLGSSRSHNVELGDLDGDGDLDAFAANGPGQADRVWLNRSRTDLSLTKTVTPSIAAPGQVITYTLVYVNRGPQAATDVTIADVVPSALTNVSYTYTGAIITSTGSVSYTWQVANLKPSQGGVITITGEVAPSVSGVFSLTNQATIATNVTDRDPHNNTSVVGNTIDAVPPLAPTLTSPVDSAVVNDTPPTLTWGTSPNSDVAGYLLDWNGTVMDVGNVNQYTVTVATNGTYTWTVAAYDGVDNTSPYTDVWALTVEAVLPQIIATAPVSAATDVSVTAPVVITFSKPINVSTFTYTVAPDPGGWAENWDGAGTVVALSHSAFSGETVYTVTVNAANDLADHPLSGAPIEWSFTTATTPVSAPDIVPPQVLAIGPVNGATDVNCAVPVVITFSEAISVCAFIYSVVPEPGGWVENWNSAATVVTLTHNFFAYQTAYTVTISAAEDLAGNPLLGAPYVWYFTTVPQRMYLPLVLK